MWRIDDTLTDTTTPGQSEPGSKEVLYIPQISRITSH